MNTNEKAKALIEVLKINKLYYRRLDHQKNTQILIGMKCYCCHTGGLTWDSVTDIFDCVYCQVTGNSLKLIEKINTNFKDQPNYPRIELDFENLTGFPEIDSIKFTSACMHKKTQKNSAGGIYFLQCSTCKKDLGNI